jgi:hypothetical protein
MDCCSDACAWTRASPGQFARWQRRPPAGATTKSVCQRTPISEAILLTNSSGGTGNGWWPSPPARLALRPYLFSGERRVKQHWHRLGRWTSPQGPAYLPAISVWHEDVNGNGIRPSRCFDCIRCIPRLRHLEASVAEQPCHGVAVDRVTPCSQRWRLHARPRLPK